MDSSNTHTTAAPLTGTPVLFVNNFGGPTLGGGEVQLLALADGCASAGMSVAVACQRGSALAVEAAARGAAVHEIDFAVARLPRAVAEVRRIATDSGAAIVQGTGFLTNVVTRVATRDLPAALVNVVHVQPGASLIDGGSRAGQAVRSLSEHATARRVDRYVAVSQAVADALVAELGVDSADITVIRNGIDAATVRRAAWAPLEAELPAGDGPLVGVVARLEAVKGVEDFVRAAAMVVASVPNARFAVAGAGSLESELHTIAVASGLGQQLRFLGHIPAVAPLLAALDVFVLPSLSEALGIAALEAMALGKPVVATRVGGLPEVVDDGVTGVLVPAGDPGALAVAIGRLLGDPERAKAMGRAGRTRVERDFTVERMAREYLALYEELLADR